MKIDGILKKNFSEAFLTKLDHFKFKNGQQ